MSQTTNYMLNNVVLAEVCGLILAICSVLPLVGQEVRDSYDHRLIKGYTWGWDGKHGDYTSRRARDSMKKLASMGCNWICISFATTMSTHEDPHFSWSSANPHMVTDQDLRIAIKTARELNLQVILKPVINCQDRVWRAWIRFFRPITDRERSEGIQGVFDPWGENPGYRQGLVQDDEKWNLWWQNYSAFLKHYAKIAQEENIEIFCIGCEMNSTENQVENWKKLISETRSIYQGSITYNVNHGRETELAWWDAVDIIGISAYYSIGTTKGPPLLETTPKAEIVCELMDIKRNLSDLSDRKQRPILFIETGLTSVRGAARYPWAFGKTLRKSPVDQLEQANYYQAMLEVFWGEPWFLGFTWWDWPVRLYQKSDADTDRGFCIYGKRAEAILRNWYARP